MLAPGPVSLGTLGLFVIPITKETGWSRTDVTSGFSFAAVGMAIGLVIVGRLLDRLSVRLIIIPSFIGFAIALGLIGTVGKDGLPIYFLYSFLVGLLGCGTSIPLSKALVSWFDNKRGIATGVMTGFWGLGQSLLPLIAGAFIASLGWRQAYFALAIVVIVVATTVVAVWVRVRAERSVRGRLVKEVVTDTNAVVTVELPGLTFKQAVRSRQFWQIALALGAAGVVVTGLEINLVPMMIDRGIAAGPAALLLSVLGIAGLVGRLAGGFLVDRIPGRVLGCIVLMCPVLGLFFLYSPYGVVAFAVFVIGLALGVENDLIAFFITRYLGTRNFGEIIGVIQAVFLISASFGPLVFSLAYDSWGTYQPMLPIFGVVLVAAAITILLLGKYRYPAIKGFDRLAAKDEFAAAELLTEQAESEDNGSLDQPILSSTANK
jgi:MFS family permease